jgi:glycosyltransferase involved in cell wall biosynthesis
MKDYMPTISVLLPVYNAEEYFFDSINCILNQTFEDSELIKLNNGSMDRSWDIVLSLKDK